MQHTAEQGLNFIIVLCTQEKTPPPSLTQTFFFDFTELLWQYWHARYIRSCFETNSSAVYLGAIVCLAGERSLQGRRINVEWLTSLCWRNEFSIHSQASRGEPSFRKVNTIWQGPTKDEKAQHGTVSKDSALLDSPLLRPPVSSRPPISMKTCNRTLVIALSGYWKFFTAAWI